MPTISFTKGAAGGVTVTHSLIDSGYPFTLFQIDQIKQVSTLYVLVQSYPTANRRFRVYTTDTITFDGDPYVPASITALQIWLRDEVFPSPDATGTPSEFDGDLDDIDPGTTNKHFTDTEKTKLSELAINSGSINTLAYYITAGRTLAPLSAITGNRALISTAAGLPIHHNFTTALEIGHLFGVQSPIQTQINAKADASDLATAVADLAKVEAIINDEFSSGVITGGIITLTGANGEFEISAGYGYRRDGTNPLRKVTWTLLSGVATDDGLNNINITDTGDGVGFLLIQTALDPINQYINLGGIQITSTFTVGYSSVQNVSLSDFQFKAARFAGNGFGALVTSGLNLAEQVTPLAVTMDAGVVNLYLSEFNVPSASVFTKLIISSDNGIGVESATTANHVTIGFYNDTSQPDGSAVVAMTAGWWKKDYFFTTIEGSLYYVFAQTQYATEVEARAAPVPFLSTEITAGVAAVASIVTTTTTTSLSDGIIDIRPYMPRIFGTGNSAAPSTVIALSGDVTGSGAGTVPTILANVATAGTKGTASKTPTVTIDSKGRTTVLTEQDIQIDKSQVTGLNSDLSGIASDINLKANIASPTFTGTVAGITPAMVGLGNVTNTSDAAKPVSTAQQTALNLKANTTDVAISATITSLRAETAPVANSKFYTSDTGKEGLWYHDAADTTTADNTGLVVVSSNGKRFKRIYDGINVDIKWFGVVGDDTDETAAVDLALTHTAGKTLILNNITVRVSALEIGGDKRKIIGNNAIIKYIADGAQPDIFIYFGSCNGLSMEGVEIDMEDLAGNETSGTTILYFDQCTGVDLTKNYIHNNGHAGIKLVSCLNVSVYNNRFDDMDSCVFVLGASDYIRVIANQFKGGTSEAIGIFNSGSDVKAERYVILGNIINGKGGAAINASHNFGGVISGNDMIDCLGGVMFYDNGSGLIASRHSTFNTVTGNTIQNCEYGITKIGSGTLVSGNNFYNIGRQAITTNDYTDIIGPTTDSTPSVGVMINNNNFYNIGTISGSNVSIDLYNLRDSTFSFNQMWLDHPTVEPFIGIRIWECEGLVVENNRCPQSKITNGSGVDWSEDILIKDNTFRYSEIAPSYPLAGAYNWRWENNIWKEYDYTNFFHDLSVSSGVLNGINSGFIQDEYMVTNSSAITSIVPSYRGRKITLHAKSSGSFTIANGATIDIGSTSPKTILTDTSITLIYNGTKWVQLYSMIGEISTSGSASTDIGLVNALYMAMP